MTRQEFFEIAGFFANPLRNTRIEIEARQVTINNYVPQYTTLTGQPLPIGSDSVYVLDNDADKWGREMRIYYTDFNPDNTPNILAQLRTIGGRPGYDIWNYRLNNIKIVDELFAVGFRLGYPQDLTLIRGNIPQADLTAFDTGFNIP